MTTETDPRLVREIAEAAFRSAHTGAIADRDDHVEAAIIASGVAGPVLSEVFDAYSAAVGAEYGRLVVRKVARTAMELAATRRDDLDSAIRRHGGLGEMPEDPEAKAEYRKAYGALYSAAAADMKAADTITVSWPDEQQDAPCPCGCPTPCPCEPDCGFCMVPNPMREPDPAQGERDA